MQVVRATGRSVGREVQRVGVKCCEVYHWFGFLCVCVQVYSVSRASGLDCLDVSLCKPWRPWLRGA